MTPRQQKALAMCLAWCKVGQKEHAWRLAKNLAEMSEEQTELPRLLTEAMNSAKLQPTSKGSASSTTATGE